MPDTSDDHDLPENAEDMICFALYSASHALGRAYQPLLRDLGLTYPQYIALTVLWREGTVPVGTICKRMRLDPSTVTPLLKRLEGLGLVMRRRGETDERQVFVSLTEAGSALRTRAPDITRCIIGATGKDMAALERLVAELSELRDAVAANTAT